MPAGTSPPPAAATAPERCFCSKPLPAAVSRPSRAQDSDDEASIYCSRECARHDAMRALELRSATPPSTVTICTPSKVIHSSSLGSDLFLSNLSQSGSEPFLSPLSAVSISSSAASAGIDSPVANNELEERSSIKLREKGSHYRVMAAAAEAAEARAEAEAEKKARRRNGSADKKGKEKKEEEEEEKNAQHLSWASGLPAGAGSATTSNHEEHILLAPELPSTAGHTPRIGSQDSKPSVSASAAGHIVALDSELQATFMDKVLAQLRLTSSPTCDAGSPTLAQLLPAFGDQDDADVDFDDATVPPPPNHPRISALTHAAESVAPSNTSATAMEATMSTQSDQTLVEPGSGSVAALAPAKDVFSPLSASSRSTLGHWSRPSNASTMTAASTASFSSVSSTKSLVQARQLRKELDNELRQMAFDLAELRRRERDAMLYGITPQRRAIGESLSRISIDLSEEMEEHDDIDAFEFDHERLEDSIASISPESAPPSSAAVGKDATTASCKSTRKSQYRWSKADRDLVSRCISTCLNITEAPRPEPTSKAIDEQVETRTSGLPSSTSCTRMWDGVPLGGGPQQQQVQQQGDAEESLSTLVPGIEVDLAYFLDSEDEEEELLRPTYELPLGFLNQPLEYSPSLRIGEGSGLEQGPTTPLRMSGQKSLHHSRSTPLFPSPGSQPAPRNRSSGQPLLDFCSSSDKNKNNKTLAVPATNFEIMAGTPLQLPARPATSPKGAPKLRQTKSRNGLFGLALSSGGGGGSGASNSSTSSISALRSVASSTMLRRGQDQRDTLARGPSSASRPSTPTAAAQIKAGSAALLAAAFHRNSPPRQRVDSRPLPAPPLDASPSYGSSSDSQSYYSRGRGIAHEPYGVGSMNKRLPVTPAGVGVGVARAKALDRLQGLLRRRILASSSALR
ncbi:hypothetical protein OC834_001566 [Tilletia horrida]|nr:hypothetical protein OC834_001566 [Tilletia horrida]